MLQEAMEKSAGNNLFRLSETAGSAYVVAGYQSQIPQHPYLGYMGGLGYRKDPRPKYGKTAKHGAVLPEQSVLIEQRPSGKYLALIQ